MEEEIKKPLKLHLGCGSTYLEGYINIDIRKTPAAEVIADARNLPYGESSVELIESYHLIEHIPRYDLPPTLKKWHKMLIPGGRVIVECPDLDGICEMYLKGDDNALVLIYGGQRYAHDTHYFGYNFKRLAALFQEAGFTEIIEKPAQDYHTQRGPCLRLECVSKNEKKQ